MYLLKKNLKRISVALLLVCNVGFANAQKHEANETPIIFNNNETLRNGDVFGVQGANFGNNPELWYAVVGANDKTVKPDKQFKMISASSRNISAMLPTNESIKEGALLAVFVKNGNKISRPIYLNKARAVSIEYDQILPNQTFRVFGRNLQFAGMSPAARLVDESNKKSLPAIVLNADAYVMTIQAPADIKTGTKYKVMVSNGNAGMLAESLSDQTLTGVATAPDPFGLKAAWGTEFTFAQNIYNIKTDTRLVLKAKGDGETDDKFAIQAAIDLANKNGGGVVYFPEGKYKLDIPSGSGLIMKSKVVLKGDGLEKTFIQYGFGTPPPYPDPIGKDGWPNMTTDGVAILWPLGVTLSGLDNLCFQNVNTSGLWRHSLKNMPPPVKKPGAGGSKFFATRCRFDFAVAWGLSWGYVDRMVISDCIFDSKAQKTWPWLWHCNGSTNFIVRNNRVKYAAGRFGFSDSYNGIIENNYITRLGDLQNPKGETGGFNIDYAADIVIMGNRQDVEGRPIENHNQGETILSQGGNPEQMATGVVAKATENSLTDTSKNWDIIKTSSLGSSDAVAIIEGKGMGQWRRLVSNNANTLQIDKPWDLVPDATSHYAVMRWSAENWLVKDNVLQDNNRGIWFYCGSTDVAIVGNKLTNSEGIYLRSDQRLVAGRYNLTWNAVVEKNEVIDNNGLRPAYVCNVLAIGTKPDSLFGVGSIGVEIRHNYVEAHTPNVGTFVRGEGYFNEVLLKNPTFSSPSLKNDVVGILGTIFQNNKVANADIAYRLSKASSQTVIKDATYRNVKAISSDSVKGNTQSENTVLMAANITSEDPFYPYLKETAPHIVKDFGQETDSVKVQKLVYFSRDVQVNGTNVPTQIYAVIARPLLPGNYPGILILHGGGGNAEVEKARKWAAKGYIAVSIDIPGIANPDKVPNTTGNWKTYKYGENRFVAAPTITNSTIFDGALASLQALYLLRSQPDVIKTKIGVTGISWGGYMTTILSGLAAPCINASFSTFGCGFYDSASTFQSLLNKMLPAERAVWIKYLDAGRRAKYISSPYFIAAATDDNWFYPPAVMATLNAINSPTAHFFAPNANHSAPIPGGSSEPNKVGSMKMEEPYFDYYLKDMGFPLPEISIINGKGQIDKTGNYNFKFFAKSKTNLNTATLYYSTDSAWTTRKWIGVKATSLNDGFYEASVPAAAITPGTWCYGSVSDDRPVTVSTEMIECK